MPDTPQVPTSPLQTQLGSGWFDDAPGGNADLDSLFPNPEGPQAPPAAPPQAPPAQPEWFLESSTGTKYRSREEAARGLEEKDKYIEKLRKELEQSKTPAPAPQAAAATQSYAQKPEGLIDDLVASLSKGDKRGYAETLARFNMELLSPYAPLLSEVSRERAIRAVEPEAQNIRQFLGSAEYTAALDEMPVLKQAIEYAESQPQAGDQLASLYKLAFRSAQASKLPQIVQNAVHNAAPPQPIRPTLSPSTPTPQMGTTAIAPRDLNTEAGRKAIIERAEQRGVQNVDFGSLGL